jgi:translation initiation factor 1
MSPESWKRFKLKFSHLLRILVNSATSTFPKSGEVFFFLNMAAASLKSFCYTDNMLKNEKPKGLVYSTDKGHICQRCENPIKQCHCGPQKNQFPTDGIVRISRQTKGRKGSGVSIISGIPLGEAELKKLAKQLKKKCGTGGTIKNGIIEIQGDHRDTLLKQLIQSGFKAKLAGG